MRKDRVTALASVVAAVVVFAIAGAVIAERSSVPDAGSTPSAGVVATDGPSGAGGTSGSLGAPGTPSGTSSGTSGVSGAAVPSGSSGRTGSSGRPGAHAVVAFLGDDYTLGDGASAKSKGFVPLLGAQLGVKAKAFGVDGGGYAKTGASGKTYADLVATVAATHPAVVVVSGGRNDRFDNLETLADAADALFTSLSSVLPHAKLVAVAPFWGDSPAPAAIKAIAGKIESAVRSAGGAYLDVPDPLTGHSSWMADAADPDDAGYAAIAAALAPVLRPVVGGG